MRNYFFLILLLFTLYSCTQEHIGYSSIGGNLHYTTTINEGSYIILHDSLLNVNDTLFFKLGSRGSASPYYNGYSFQYLNYYFIKNQDTISPELLTLYFSATGTSRSLNMTFNYKNNNILFYNKESNVYDEPFEIGYLNSYDDISYEYVATYNEYTIGNKSYKTVFESNSSYYSPTTNDTTFCTFFYSMHSGIIKISARNKDYQNTFEVVESHILR